VPRTWTHEWAVTEGTSGSVKDRLTGLPVCRLTNPVGEPGAANPHARFDERDVERSMGSYSGTGNRKGRQHARLLFTAAPAPDSSPFPCVQDLIILTRMGDKGPNPFAAR
jgi:hypothetical protein